MVAYGLCRGTWVGLEAFACPPLYFINNIIAQKKRRYPRRAYFLLILLLRFYFVVNLDFNFLLFNRLTLVMWLNAESVDVHTFNITP
jgi:hypothetical protein